MVDPFDQQRYANANIGVFGHSGAGKTYLLSAIAMGALGRGVQVYVIDPEHEYGDLAKRLGGVDVPLALGSGHALNVLELPPADRRHTPQLRRRCPLQGRRSRRNLKSAPPCEIPRYWAALGSILATGGLTRESFVHVMFQCPWRRWEKLGALAGAYTCGARTGKVTA